MSHGDCKSPQDRIVVPSVQHRAWLGSRSLIPQREGGQEVQSGALSPLCRPDSQPPPEAQRGQATCLRPHSGSGQSQDWDPGLAESRAYVPLTIPGWAVSLLEREGWEREEESPSLSSCSRAPASASSACPWRATRTYAQGRVWHLVGG